MILNPSKGLVGVEHAGVWDDVETLLGRVIHSEMDRRPQTHTEIAVEDSIDEQKGVVEIRRRDDRGSMVSVFSCT